jgi:hypothetical protein
MPERVGLAPRARSQTVGVHQVDWIIGHIHIAVEGLRVVGGAGQRVHAHPAALRGVVLAKPGVVETRLRIELHPGKPEIRRHGASGARPELPERFVEACACGTAGAVRAHPGGGEMVRMQERCAGHARASLRLCHPSLGDSAAGENTGE